MALQQKANTARSQSHLSGARVFLSSNMFFNFISEGRLSASVGGGLLFRRRSGGVFLGGGSRRCRALF